MKVLALVLLLFSFSSLTLTEVVNSFEQSCPSLFILNPKKDNERIIPTIFSGRQYKKICQRWKNVYRFATVYDTEKKIPVYSAYTFHKEVTTRRDETWKIEPQLEDIDEYKNKQEMMDSPSDKETEKLKKIKNQAVDLDYIGSNYSRGHLFPNSFAADEDQAESTFTLTNTAPQLQSSNEKWAQEVEEPMLKFIKVNCRLNNNHQAYIVTGVVPGNKWTNVTGGLIPKKQINIPSHYWSVFCCTDKKNKLIMKAYIAEQEPFKVRTPSIQRLNELLTDLYKKGIPFRVFPGLEVNDIESNFNLKSIHSFLQSVIHFLYSLSSQVISELEFSL